MEGLCSLPLISNQRRHFYNMKKLKYSHIFAIHKELLKIAKRLNGLDCYSCNFGDLSKRQENTLNKLENRAEELAQGLKLHAYHQTDPRGCSLYLVEDLKGADINYTNGVCIY